MLLLQKHLGGLVRATFSKSITNQAGPLLELPPFVGAAVSVLPLPQAADHERVQIIGDKRPRDARGCDDDLGCCVRRLPYSFL
jgi:hypothetical protein